MTKEQLIQIAAQYVVPVMVALGYYVVAGVAGSVLGRWSNIEAWCAANPKRALVYQVLRGTGLDIKKLLEAVKAYAAARSAFPPIISTSKVSELVPTVGVVTTETTNRITVEPSTK
jgi:hypothetical protein